MTQEELKALATTPSRKLLKWGWLGIGIAIICINTPLIELGYWIFGSALTWLGFVRAQIRGIETHTRLGDVKEIDSGGRVTIETEGIQIMADTNQIVKSEIAADVCFIKGTAIFFKYEQ